jgi:hypothetical protein
MGWTEYWTTGGGGAQPAYNQYEWGGCQIGCGPVALTMMFLWADHQAGSGNAYWAPRFGLYRQNGGRGADVVAPLTQDPGVDSVIQEIHNDVGTFCIFDNGATTPWDMPGAWNYLNGRTYTRFQCDWDSLGIDEDGLRDKAISSIRDRQTPAVIGTGWLSHYPLAFGYAWEQVTVQYCFIFCWTETEIAAYFYVNEGWGGGGAGDWVDASTWFAGQIFP